MVWYTLVIVHMLTVRADAIFFVLVENKAVVASITILLALVTLLARLWDAVLAGALMI